LNRLAEAFPLSRFTGYDFSEESIAATRAEAERRGLRNVRFVVKDVAKLEETERYGLITAFDAVHDQAEPAQVLKGIAGALLPEGTFLMQDIAGSSHLHKNMEHPIGPFGYTISCMHCMTVSLERGGARAGRDVGRGSGASDAEGSGLQEHRGAKAFARHHQQLLRGPEDIGQHESDASGGAASHGDLALA
jgi:hypothetical protein